MATVHLTHLVEPSGNPSKQAFCESCYRDVEAEQWKSYNCTESTLAFPADLEKITACQVLEASELADRNGADKPVYKRIIAGLSNLPETQERLRWEMLSLTWAKLERGEEPGDELTFVFFPKFVPAKRREEYLGWLEKIILRCFELRAQYPYPPGEHGPFAWPLFMGLRALGRLDRDRFKVLLEKLKRQIGEANPDSRWKLITDVEKSWQPPTAD